MIGLVGDVVDYPTNGVPSVQGPLRSAQDLNTRNVVKRILGCRNTKVRGVNPVVVGADPWVTTQASEVTPNATDLDVPGRTRGRRDEVDHLVRTLYAHVFKEILIHRRNRDGGIRYRRLDPLPVDEDFLDARRR